MIHFYTSGSFLETKEYALMYIKSNYPIINASHQLSGNTEMNGYSVGGFVCEGPVVLALGLVYRYATPGKGSLGSI